MFGRDSCCSNIGCAPGAEADTTWAVSSSVKPPQVSAVEDHADNHNGNVYKGACLLWAHMGQVLRSVAQQLSLFASIAAIASPLSGVFNNFPDVGK